MSTSPPDSRQNTIERNNVRKYDNWIVNLGFLYFTGAKAEWKLCKIWEGGFGRKDGEDGGKKSLLPSFGQYVS